MEAVKSYRIPVEIPKDLIEEYFKVKQKALDAIFSHVKISKKAHLEFDREDRRELRDELLREWKYSKHYVDSTMNSVVGLVKGWITLYNKGKAEGKPEITKRTVYIKSTLFSFRNGILRVSVEPSKRYLEVDLSKCSWIPRDFDKVGGLLMTERELIVTVKKRVEPKAEKWASFDVNLTNITAFIGGEIKRYDLRELYHIHRVYETKLQRIQKLSKIKPNTSKRLLEKYSRREGSRAKDFMHKLTTQVAGELKEKSCGAILENLKGVKRRILNKSKDMNRKLSKWSARTFQLMLEYKLKWLNLPVKYVNPANSSKTCPACSGSMASYLGRMMKCEECGLTMDRDIIAVLNLQMRGEGFPQRDPDELIEGEGLSRNKSNICIPT
ncbi:MAG: transposase [Thermoprotei archaeon]